ncbi:hypothetical protein MYXA107069_35065 [Myxococcus xanthus]|nr:hypothetical protein MyxoNM_09530 [Myxococcus xanthus]SDY25945.1 hypothetical protein SAMN05444383_12827 [Myxococcus xanthus]
MTERFECICGSLRKTLPAANIDEVLIRFRGYMNIYADRLGDATSITIRGPVRVGQAATEHVFDRVTGEWKASIEPRTKRRR